MGTGFLSGWWKCSGIEEWWWYMLCIHLLGIIKKLVVIDSYLDIKILIVTPKPKGIYISMHMSSKLFNFPQENLIFFSDLGPQICFNSWHLHTAFSLNKPFHPITDAISLRGGKGSFSPIFPVNRIAQFLCLIYLLVIFYSGGRVPLSTLSIICFLCAAWLKFFLLSNYPFM